MLHKGTQKDFPQAVRSALTETNTIKHGDYLAGFQKFQAMFNDFIVVRNWAETEHFLDDPLLDQVYQPREAEAVGKLQEVKAPRRLHQPNVVPIQIAQQYSEALTLNSGEYYLSTLRKLYLVKWHTHLQNRRK